MYFGLWIYISTTLGCALYWTKYTFPLLQETYANILACDYTTNEPEFEDISDEAKGGLISESFSLYLKSPNKCAKPYSKRHKTLFSWIVLRTMQWFGTFLFGDFSVKLFKTQPSLKILYHVCWLSTVIVECRLQRLYFTHGYNFQKTSQIPEEFLWFKPAQSWPMLWQDWSGKNVRGQ